jgi:hypothetical protein
MGRHLRVERNPRCQLTCLHAFEKAVLKRIGSNRANRVFSQRAKHVPDQPLLVDSGLTAFEDRSRESGRLFSWRGRGLECLSVGESGPSASRA